MKLIAFLLLSLFAPLALAGNVTITWEPPTTCDDGSPVANCPTTSYEIWIGTSQTGTSYTKRTEAVAPPATSITLVNVLAGSRCFYMKTVAGALTSGESNRMCVNVPVSGPKAPFINVTIAIPTP